MPALGNLSYKLRLKRVGWPQIHLIFYAPLSDFVQTKRFVTSRVQTSSPFISQPDYTDALYLYHASS